MTADWQVFPSTSWNYALVVDEESVGKLPVDEQPVGASPFSLKETPLKLQINAHKLHEWRAVDGVADPVPQSPVTSDQLEEQLTLVPYAAAKLRITAFPQASKTS